MKTKNLLTAFALSAMFAACSQDAELNEVIAKNDFSNVPVVEAGFTANIGAESRMATQFGWELGDKVGLAWLGDGHYVKPAAGLEGAAFQNHPLFCVDASKKAFKTETMLYVGNYYAYMPYTEGNMTVEFIKFDIAKQPLTADSDDLAKQAIYLSKKDVKLQKANPDGTVDENSQKAGMGNNVNLNLALVNNPTKIDFTFKNVENLTNLKVTGVSIDMYNTQYTANPLTVNGFTRGNMPADWTEYSSNDFYGYSPATKGAVTLEGELPVINNALTTYALLLPVSEAKAGINRMVINLTTNYGNVTLDNVEVNNTKVFTHFGQTGVVATVEVDGKNIKKTTATAKTQTELDEILTQLEELGQTDPVAITLNPATAASTKAAFVLTDFTLPADLKTIVTLTAGNNTNGTIEFAGENNVINKQIALSSNALVTGKMVVNNITGKATISHGTPAGADIIVSNGAVLTNNGLIGGNIVVKTVAADEEEELAFGKYISNASTAKLANPIYNLGEAQWIAGLCPTLADITGKKAVYAEATNLAELIAAADANVKEVRLIDAVIENKGDNFTVNGVRVLKCYGNVAFELTQSNNGMTRGLNLPDVAKIVVEEAATLEIVGGAKTTFSIANSASIFVEKNATLDLQNLTLNATVENNGTVELYKCSGIVPGSKVGNWNEEK